MPVPGQSGLLEVRIEDEIRYATVTLSPAAIMWADGDIWVQKMDAPNKTPRKSCWNGYRIIRGQLLDEQSGLLFNSLGGGNYIDNSDQLFSHTISYLLHYSNHFITKSTCCALIEKTQYVDC